MSVKWTKLNIPLGQGIDTKTDPKALPVAKLEVLENGVFTKRISIKKRNGYQAIGGEILGGGSVEQARALTTRNAELLVFDDSNAYSYADGAEKWINKGPLLSLGVTQETAAYTTAEQTGADSASADGMTVYAWADSEGGVRFTAVDTESGAILVHNRLISSTGTKPRCIGFAGHVHILYVEASSNALMNKRISSARPIESADDAAITVVNDIDSTHSQYDVKPYGGVGILAYFSSGDELKLGYLAINGEIGSPGNGGHPTAAAYAATSECSSICVAVHPEDGTFLVGIVLSDFGLIVVAINESLDFHITNGVFPSTADGEEGSGDGLLAVNITAAFETEARSDGLYHCQFFYELPATDSWNHYVKSFSMYVDIEGDEIVDTTGYTWRHAGLASHAFDDNGSVYVNLVHDSPQQATYFTTRADSVLTGKYLQGISGGLAEGGNLPSVYSASRVHTWVGIFKNRRDVDTGTGDTYSEKGIKKIALNFDHSQSHRSVQVGDSTYITGGFLQLYDGGQPVESGFHLYPESVSAVASNTTSGTLTSDGTYNYQCYWEWYTSSGERELSATASGVQVTLGASDDTVTLTVPTLSFTAKKPGGTSGVRLAVTRTASNGTTRYRVDNPAAPTWNNPSADTITFIDSLADSAAAVRELDYTNAEFDHIAPPSAEIIAATKDRIFLAGFEDPNLVRFSKLRTWGTAVAFSDTFQILLDQAGGAVTALAPIDDKVIVFKEQRIFAFAGDGPDNTGLAGDNFPSPQLVTSDVGCVNQRSILEMPLGLMFQSNKGIYLIDRSLQLNYIGADVEDFNSQTITAATLMTDRNLAIFLCASGKTLAYDYFFNQWSTFTNHEGTDAIQWRDVYVYSKSNGEIRKEVPGYHKDINSAIKLAMETGWISFDGLQGFARVKRAVLLGDYKSAHTLKTSIGYDYEPYLGKSAIWDPTLALSTLGFMVDTVFGETGGFGAGGGAFGGLSSNVYQVRIQMPRQKCEAIKFRFEDILGDTPGESFELNALTLEVGLKKNTYKLGDGKTIG